MPRRAALLALALAGGPRGAGGVQQGWSCAVAAGGQSTCFVSSCSQLVGALATGIAHLTLQAHLTPDADVTYAACAEAFPLRVSRPLTLVGACGGADGRCTLHGGATVLRTGGAACLRGCVACTGGGGRGIFAVRAGGHLTLDNLLLTGACNPAGDGGAVSLAGGEQAAASTQLPGRRALLFRASPPPPPPPSLAAAAVARLTATRCAFASNAALGGAGWDGAGGGVALLNAQTLASFTDCTFSDNFAWGADGAATSYDTDWGDGGGVYVSGGVASFDTCRFERCEAERHGGGVAVLAGGAATFASSVFSACGVADDYFDGGGGAHIGGLNSSASFSLCRFQDCAVNTYPDPRRQSLTCGGGAASVVSGAAASFTYTVFTLNAAPRGGAVCAHDAAASFDAVVLPPGENVATRDWLGAPGGAVECVQCGARDVPSRACVYLRDEQATARERAGDGVCRPLPGTPVAALLRGWWLTAQTFSDAASSSGGGGSDVAARQSF
jgi:hypothetical protein